MNTNKSSRSQTIWNTLRLGGLLALLGAGTALAEPSFQWENDDPETGHYTYTTEQTVDVHAGGTLAVNKIDLDSLGTGGPEGVTYALSSVIVSVSLVPDANTDWVLAASEDMVLNNLTFTANYSVTLQDQAGQTQILTLQNLLDTGTIPIPIGEGETHAFSIPNSPTESATWLTFDASTSSESLDDLFAGSGSTQVGSIAAGGADGVTTTVADPDSLDGLVASATTPGFSLRVTITYNVVPEPTSLALLMTGAAFLLRRRRKLVK